MCLRGNVHSIVNAKIDKTMVICGHSRLLHSILYYIELCVYVCVYVRCFHSLCVFWEEKNKFATRHFGGGISNAHTHQYQHPVSRHVRSWTHKQISKLINTQILRHTQHTKLSCFIYITIYVNFINNNKYIMKYFDYNYV